MNFQDLLTKLKTLDESSNSGMEECGDSPRMAGADDLLVGEEHGEMMSPMVSKQSDNISMNVSINGSGAGGIKDLLDVLRNIESGNSEKDVIVGMDEELTDGGFKDATTEPDEIVAGVDAVTRTGNDLASKGAESPKVNGGGNPMQETLVRKLSSFYEEVKSR